MKSFAYATLLASIAAAAQVPNMAIRTKPEQRIRATLMKECVAQLDYTKPDIMRAVGDCKRMSERKPLHLVDVEDHPVNPTDPSNPADPVVPVDPLIPVDPLVPVDPLDPVDPVDPVVPVDPVDPLEPVDPVDPVVPSPNCDTSAMSGDLKFEI